MAIGAPVAAELLSDDDLVVRCRCGDENAVRLLTQRYNQRLFRVARGIVRDDAEAEDVVQETYVRAFSSLNGFRGDSNIATWLTRIAINEALGRIRRYRPQADVNDLELADPHARSNPEVAMEQRHLRQLLEGAIDRLPVPLRMVFVARLVEGLSVDETANLFGLKTETVKTRLHRSRQRIRASLNEQLGGAVQEAFSFDGERCERTTEAVLRRLIPTATPET